MRRVILSLAAAAGWTWLPQAAISAPADAFTTVTAAPSAPGEGPVTGLARGQIRPTWDGLATTGPVTFDEQKMMRAKDVRPGMKGYGMSVFSGIRPERFEAEVVGVAHGFLPGDDLILCMLSHPVLKDIGVVAGMSGSPVYIEGKLIGAVAYGWTYSKEPLAGVTPIESMLKVYNSTPWPGTAAPREQSAAFSSYNKYMAVKESLLSGRPVELPAFGGGPTAAAATLSPEAQSRLGLSDGQVRLVPLTAPIYVSSRSPEVQQLAARLFGDSRVIAAPAGAGASAVSGSADAENSPGGPVTDLNALSDELAGGYGLAIPIVEGDTSLAGVGTVTWREGRRLIAFGHPMFEYGIVDYPMAAARINTIIRNSVRPFKLGESVGQIGVVRQDRLPAIGGTFGDKANMFPVRSTIEDASYHGRREMNFRVWNDREMGAMYALVGIMDSMSGISGLGGDKAVLYRYEIVLEDGTTITKENYLAQPGGGMMAAFDVMSDMGLMANNPYRSALPQSVSFEATVANRLPQAMIESIQLDKPYYHAGDRVTVEVEVQPYREQRQTVRQEFTLPSNLPEGVYSVTAGYGMMRYMQEAQISPGSMAVNDYDSLLRMVRRNYPANKVYVTLTDQDTGLSIRGQEMPRLPGSVISTLQQADASAYVAPRMGNFVVDAEIGTNFEVSGAQTAVLTVKRRGQ